MYMKYQSLNGTTKTENFGRDAWFTIPGSGSHGQLWIKRHCGGLLAVEMTLTSVREITEEAMRSRLSQTGMELPWEVCSAN